MDKQIIHEDCGGKIEIKKDWSGCGDPECCGEREITIFIKCDKCHLVQEI